MDELEKILATAITAAKAAGKLIAQHSNKHIEISFKDPQNVVTKTDIAADQTIKEIIQNDFPHHAIFSEESGLTAKSDEHTWVIDPLDGTSNFSRHLGQWCTSIAVVHAGKTIVGVIFTPLTNELFTATTNQAAKMNNNSIQPSTEIELSRAAISLGRNPSQLERFATMTSHIIPRVRSTRMLGSVALQLCYVAAGRLDAHIDNGCNFYDGAAGAFIAQRAGTMVSNFTGEPWQPEIQGAQDLLVTNKQLHPQFIKILNT